ncbi:MAG TPA: SAM-dependent methyltransferase, partial [Polyangiaceae bacterium]|nr:SAM-dependent methyltransferase [Polyangiaceae bacterium]
MREPLVSNVSDTARWVAILRAWETARPDALFHDPFAERLGGEQGKRIAEKFKRVKSSANGWPIITRTKLIDDLVRRSIGDGCDCVLNLAAGFDTRPYRLSLPSDITWVEADLPPLVEEKTRALAGEKPVCRLRVEKVDLADPAARAALFDDVSRSAKQVLVITEGLVTYLEEEQVRALGRDLHARGNFRYWMLDVTSPAILAML